MLNYQLNKPMYKKYALIFSLMIVLSGCSTVVTTVDMATTGAIKVIFSKFLAMYLFLALAKGSGFKIKK